MPNATQSPTQSPTPLHYEVVAAHTPAENMPSWPNISPRVLNVLCTLDTEAAGVLADIIRYWRVIAEAAAAAASDSPMSPPAASPPPLPFDQTDPAEAGRLAGEDLAAELDQAEAEADLAEARVAELAATISSAATDARYALDQLANRMFPTGMSGANADCRRRAIDALARVVERLGEAEAAACGEQAEADERRLPNDCLECARSHGPHYQGPCEHAACEPQPGDSPLSLPIGMDRMD